MASGDHTAISRWLIIAGLVLVVTRAIESHPMSGKAQSTRKWDRRYYDVWAREAGGLRPAVFFETAADVAEAMRAAPPGIDPHHIVSAVFSPRDGFLYLLVGADFEKIGPGPAQATETAVYRLPLRSPPMAERLFTSRDDVAAGPDIFAIESCPGDPGFLYVLSDHNGFGQALQRIDAHTLESSLVGTGIGGVHCSPDGESILSLDREYQEETTSGRPSGFGYERLFVADPDGGHKRYLTDDNREVTEEAWLTSTTVAYAYRIVSGASTGSIHLTAVDVVTGSEQPQDSLDMIIDQDFSAL